MPKDKQKVGDNPANINPTQEILQKIRNSLIHKIKEPYNWFHILTCRIRWLFSSTPNGWLYNVKMFIDSYQPDCIRYYTNMSFRLDKKIRKVMNQYVSDTKWVATYEHDCDNEDGNFYPFTTVYFWEEQSKEVYSKWSRALENKIHDIAEAERQFRVASVYVSDFNRTYLDRNVYFHDVSFKPRKEVSDE